MRKKIILACEICHQRNYSTSKNATNQSERLEVRKFCSRCNEHTIHRETK